MRLLVGTSGWQYRDWRGPFYPERLPPARWLEHYADHFPTVEVNNSFYRLPEAPVFTAWAERTPPGFVIAAKASRYLTHIKRLRDPAEPVARFVDRARCLGGKRGPVLLQLPPDLAVATAALDETLGHFPAGWRVAVEPRHPSWWCEETYAVLERHGAALCLADRRGPMTPLRRTADWGYVRFHEGRAQPAPGYGERALDTWARRMAGLFPADEDVYAYFNNDARACAVRDARAFARRATGAGALRSA
jgi:uncharacterized protein YecE (DUF72 family)